MTKPTLPTEWNSKTAKQALKAFEDWHAQQKLGPEAEQAAQMCIRDLQFIARYFDRMPDAMVRAAAESFADLERALKAKR